MTEVLVVLVVALLVLGPNRLPELARSLGRGMGEFRRASNDLRNTLTGALEEPPEAPRAPGRPPPSAVPPPPATVPPAPASDSSPSDQGAAGAESPGSPDSSDLPDPSGRPPHG